MPSRSQGLLLTLAETWQPNPVLYQWGLQLLYSVSIKHGISVRGSAQSQACVISPVNSGLCDTGSWKCFRLRSYLECGSSGEKNEWRGKKCAKPPYCILLLVWAAVTSRGRTVLSVGRPWFPKMSVPVLSGSCQNLGRILTDASASGLCQCQTLYQWHLCYWSSKPSWDQQRIRKGTMAHLTSFPRGDV